MPASEGVVTVRAVTPHSEPIESESIAALEQELELARAREARLRADNHQLADALERAERELTELPTLRDEAEIGRRARDAELRLAMLESSSSWRLTRPLRAMSTEVRRVAERLRER